MKPLSLVVALIGLLFALRSSGLETRVVSKEATIQGGTSAGLDVSESGAGYLHVKYHAGLDSARKAYFQFDLVNVSADLEREAFFTVFFRNSYQQRVQLYALKHASPSFSDAITWNSAPANQLDSNRLLTHGTYLAETIGSVRLLPVSGTAPFTFTIARLGDFVFDETIVLALAGEEDAQNNAAGLRIQNGSATLSFSRVADQSPGKYDVYLVGGQSNQDGRGVTSELTGTNKSYANSLTDALVFYANPVNQDSFNPTYSTGWQTLAPGFSVPPGFSGTLPSNRFGPELSFAHVLLNTTSNRVALIKVTQGGTSLSGDWRPATGYMYATLTNTVTTALQQLRTNGNSATVRGMIWHQGESDGSGSAALNYETNLTQFIEAVRRDVGIANLPFVVGELATNKPVMVRNAQFAVSQNVPFVGFASADGLLTTDGTHFDTESVLTMGQRFAAGLESALLRIESISTQGSMVTLRVQGLAQSSFLIQTTTCLMPIAGWSNTGTNVLDELGRATVSFPAGATVSFYRLQE